jgi:hypothetical protein
LPYDAFGHLANSTIDGKGACAATAIINSFVYLQDTASGIYDGRLIPGDDLAGARAELHRDIWSSGTGDQQFVWEQKLRWFSNHGVSGLATFSGMSISETSGWFQSSSIVGREYPTWNYLWDAIAQGDGVEIGLYSHMMTLVGLRFDDQGTHRNGVWDSGVETAWLDFIDPESPGSVRSSQIVPIGGALMLTQVAYASPCVFYAFAAHAVPEPATTIVWYVLAWISAIAWRRSRLVDIN